MSHSGAGNEEIPRRFYFQSYPIFAGPIGFFAKKPCIQYLIVII